MPEMPAELQNMLEDRIREEIASEVRGDVSALYSFTLPSIRERRIADRGDEPGLSLADITVFVSQIKEAHIESIYIDRYEPAVTRFSNCPAALTITKVRYNGGNTISTFRTIWVYSEGKWFSTALGKTKWFDHQSTQKDL